MLRDYYYFTLADFKVIFDRMKTSEIFNRVDVNWIMERVAKYADDRFTEAQRQVQSEHEYTKNHVQGTQSQKRPNQKNISLSEQDLKDLENGQK